MKINTEYNFTVCCFRQRLHQSNKHWRRLLKETFPRDSDKAKKITEGLLCYFMKKTLRNSLDVGIFSSSCIAELFNCQALD